MIKYIIHIIVTIVMLCMSMCANAQCYDPNWDWEKPEEWIIHYRDGKQNYSPFDKNRASADIRRVIDNDGLKRSEGWVLLYKNLGCDAVPVEQPRVIFYNKFRSIIRVMAIHREGPRASSGLLEVDWGSGATNRSSLLTHSNLYSYPNSKYPDQSGDRVVNTIESYVSADDAWWVSDFQVAFDHTTNSSQRSAYLTFRSYNIVESNLEIEGTVDLTSKSIDLKGANKGNTEGDKQNWAVKGVKAVQSLKPGEWSDYLDKASKAFESINQTAVKNWDKNKAWSGVGSAAALLARATKGEGKLGKALKGIAEGAGVVGSVIGIAADLFGLSGKSANEPSPVQIAPFATTGTISQKGFIKTQTDEESYTLDLPGIKPDANTYYTCPLGVLNLESDIKVDKTVWKETKNIFYDYKIGDISISSGNISNPSITLETALFFKAARKGFNNKELIEVNEDWKSLSLKENVKLAINSASDLKLITAVVAFQGQVQPKSENENVGAYNLFQKYEFLPKEFTENMEFRENMRTREKRTITKGKRKTTTYAERSLKDRWFNKTFDYLNRGVYKMVSGGETSDDGTINTLYKFRTGYVDINKAKELSITVRKETLITLKIIAILQDKNDPNSPMITLTNEYAIDEPSEATIATNLPFAFLRNQFEKYPEENENEKRLVLTDNLFKFETTTRCPAKNPCSKIHKPIISGGYNYPSGVYYSQNDQLETSGIVNVEATSFVAFQANQSVTLKPGFSVKTTNAAASFTAEIVNDPKTIKPTTTTPLTNIVKYYKDGTAYTTPQDCDCSPKAGKRAVSTEANNETIDAEISNNDLRIYPNPGKDLITIAYQRKSSRPAQIIISNVMGSVVLEQKQDGNLAQLDISSLNAGVYILTIFDEGEQLVKKFVKKN